MYSKGIRRAIASGVKSIEHGRVTDEATAKLIAKKGCGYLLRIVLLLCAQLDGSVSGGSVTRVFKPADSSDRRTVNLTVVPRFVRSTGGRSASSRVNHRS